MKRFINLISLIFVTLLAIITVFPFIYMLLASLMTYAEATSVPPTLIPSVPQFANFAKVFDKAPFVQYFINTVFVSLSTTFGILITSVLSAFALVKLEFKYKNLLLMVLISLMMIPYEAIVFTNYNTIARLGLLDTYTALIIPSVASIFYIYYLQGYFKGIPASYYKAAKIDGCGDFEFIRRILIPLAKPALVTVGILSFISGWNSFLWPLLVTNKKSMRLLNNGLTAFTTETGSFVELQMAAATLTIIPVIIIYFIFKKEIIRGVAKNGIKG